jgi:branched-chain amino acid transport system substrate-binding protein
MMRAVKQVVAIALTVPIVLSWNWAWAGEAQVVKIGVQLPLTGERAQVGKAMQNGVRLALDVLNSRMPRDETTIDLVFEDDGNTKEGALNALKNLIGDPRVVAIIGEIFSPFVLASKPIVEREGVPFLTGGTHPKTTENSRWIYRVGASDTLLTTLMAQYTVERLAMKRIAVIHDRTGIHAARADLVIKTLQLKYGIIPTVRGQWNPGDKEFTALLSQVKASGAEALVALGETTEAGPLLQQVRALALKLTLIAQRDFGAPAVLEVAKEAADGIYILTEYLPGISGANWRGWANAYRQRYQTEPNNIAAAYYDALFLLAEALKHGGAGREGIRTGLDQIMAFPGVLGEYTFDQAHEGLHQLYVVQIRGGKPTVLETLKATR